MPVFACTAGYKRRFESELGQGKPDYLAHSAHSQNGPNLLEEIPIRESLVTPHASEWIYPDGTHLTPGAYQIYVGMILDAISADLKPEEIGAPLSDSPLPDDYNGEVASVNKAHQA